MADVITRFKVESSEYERKIKSAKGQLGDFEKGVGSLTQALGINMSALTKLGTAIGAITTAVKVAKDAFFSTEAGVDEWGRTVEAATSSYNAFCQSLANGDFSTFLGNLGNIIDRAKETYNALDNLKTVGGIISNQEAMLNSKRAKDLKTIRDPNATDAQKTAARADLKTIQSQKGAAIDQTKLLNNNYIKSALRNQAGTLTDAEYKKYYPLIVRSLYDSAAKDILDKTKVRHQGVQAISNGNGQYTYQKTVSEINVGDLFTDKFREGLNPYIQAYWNADTRKYNEERADNRLMGMGRGSGGSTGGGRGNGTTPVDIKSRMLFSTGFSTQEQIASLMPSSEMYDTSALKELADITENIRQMDLSSLESLVQYKSEDVGFTKSDFENGKNQGKGKRDEKEVSALDASEQIVGGLSNITSSLEQLGVDIPEGMQKGISVLSTILSVASSIAAIVTAIEAINAADAVIPFAHGGIVPQYAARGKAFTHGTDTIPAVLSPGETVLTKAMTNNIASQLNGGLMGNLQLSAIIRGEDIRLALNNNSRRRGKGEYITSRS